MSGRVVDLTPEVADFLAQQLAAEVHGELQSKVEFKPDLDVAGFNEARSMMNRHGETIDLLVNDRRIEVTTWLLSFVGGVLGAREVFELDGWASDDPEYSRARRLARAAFDELRTAAEAICRAELAEDGIEAVSA